MGSPGADRNGDGGQVIYWPSCKHASMQDCLPINKKCCVPHQYDINLLAPTESSVGGRGGAPGFGAVERPSGHDANGYTRTRCLRIRQKPI